MLGKLSKLFISFVVLELVLSLILLFLLPNVIPIQFSYMLSRPVAQGSKFYVLTLPVTLLVGTLIVTRQKK